MKFFEIFSFIPKALYRDSGGNTKMTDAQLYTVIALVLYASAMAVIGFISYGKSKTLDGFLIGGRKVGAWSTAFAYGSSYFSAVFPAFTLINYNVWVPKKKHDEDVADEEIDAKHIPQIDPEVMKMVMQIKDTSYHPINAEETHTAIPNIPRSIDACIIKTEKQENQEENQNTI